MTDFKEDLTYEPKGFGYTNKIGAAQKLAKRRFPGEPSMASDYTKQIMKEMTFKEIEMELGIKMKKGGIVRKKRGGMIKKFSSGGAAKRGFGKVIK